MGGVSESTFQIQPTGSETDGPTGLFKGILFFFNDPSTPCICDVAILWKTSSLSRSVQCILGTVSTSNNGGFTSIRTKVPICMYFQKKKKNKVAAVLCVDLYFISMS